MQGERQCIASLHPWSATFVFANSSRVTSMSVERNYLRGDKNGTPQIRIACNYYCV